MKSPRLFDIASDQIRGLRSRMFVDALMNSMVNGALIRAGNTVETIDSQAGFNRPKSEYAKTQNADEVTAAFRYPTSLLSLPVCDFDRIARHGYEVADATLAGYHPAKFSRAGFSWKM